MLSKSEIINIASKYDNPIYLYNADVIKKQIKKVKTHFHDFNILYSMKCNPYEGILRLMHDNGVGIDAASMNEVHMAVHQGIEKNNIYYSSPGKTADDLNQTIGKCNIIADSIIEIERINAIAKKQKMRLEIGVRLNVSNNQMQSSRFEIMSGKASQFGIDISTFMIFLDSNRYDAIDIIGIHIYFGSQLLDEKNISENFNIIAKIYMILKKQLDIKYINFGGGFGIPYEEFEKELNLSLVQKMIEKSKAIQSVKNDGIKCNIELGRYLTAQSGIFVTRVVDKKISFGETFCIVQGGMNNFFRPSFMGQTHKIVPLFDANKRHLERVTITGSLCTPLDVFAKDVCLPTLNIGDFIMFKNAGAYGYSMSMLEFISHELPAQIMW